MAYERITITYEVIWKAITSANDQYGMVCPISFDSSDYETELEARKHLVDAGYVLYTAEDPYPYTGEVGWIDGPYRRGQIIRFLKEVKS